MVLALTALSLGIATAQTYRVGANVAPGAVVEVPEVATTAGHSVRSGVPTVIVFAQVRDCDLCTAVGPITRRWTERYPNVQVVVVETRSRQKDVEAWADEYGVPIVYDAEGQFREAFDTNLTHVYLLDGTGTVRDKARPQYRQQWLALDAQMARANAGDWEAVDANSVALPALGDVARSSPSVALGGGTPVAVIVGDGYCYFCRDLVNEHLQKELNELIETRPGLRVYLLEPSKASMADGFYGTPTHDYGPRSLFEAFIDTFGEDAAGAEIVKYIESGELTYPLPEQVWPDTGWAAGITLIRYTIGGPDDPVIAWGYGEKESPGMLVFGADGSYLGPTPFFLGNTARSLAAKVRSLLPE
jgi:hypothetical protein